jgi:hypothetical protein
VVVSFIAFGRRTISRTARVLAPNVDNGLEPRPGLSPRAYCESRIFDHDPICVRDSTVDCLPYSSTDDPLWSNLAYAIAASGVVAVGLVVRRSLLAVAAVAALGVLVLSPLFEASRRSAL